MQIIRQAAIAIAAIFSVAASPVMAGPAAAGSMPATNWLAKTTVTPSGSHVLGNPDAAVKLAEYISYTCPHCAHFYRQSDSTLRLTYVMAGRLSVEVRHFIRDPVDLTVAMLTNCVDPAGFFRRHGVFLFQQDKWIKVLQTASKTQKQRWVTGEMPERLRAIASDFGFYDIMEQQGISRAQVDHCLADKAMADRLITQTEDGQKLGVEGTPSFVLNGILLAGTYDWDTLSPQLEARF